MLESIYDNQDESYSVLYQLLCERQPFESISHSGMPTWSEHTTFINKRPYKGWYLIVEDNSPRPNVPIGSIYITYKNEIGISIFERYRRKGFATSAILDIMNRHKEKFYLANINPVNEKSINLFKKMNFVHIQQTYKLERKEDVVS